MTISWAIFLMNVKSSALSRFQAAIAAAEHRYGRAPGSVTLLAVSKGQSIASIAALVAGGQRCIGENYVQEALAKQEALAGRPIEWHFIGALQSNKTAPVSARFDWVHTVDRVKTAERLDAQRPPERSPLQVCIEVNVSGEPSKSGVAPAALGDLARRVATLPRLQLRGLMTLPAPTTDFDIQRHSFRQLASLLAMLRAEGFDLDTLSMGTTGDFEAAIAEGATIVRIGAGLFGPRLRKTTP